MSITVTFKGENLAQIEQQAVDFLTGTMSDDQIVDLIGTFAESVNIIPTRKPVAAPKPVEQPVAEPVEEPVSGPFPVAAAKDEAPSTASPAADTSGATSVEAPSDVPDYAIVREAVLRLAVVKTPEITRALLDTYGVRKAADLDPSRWAALLADVIAAMA
jgi:hypothetical protein